MTARAILSRLWFVGWFVAWILTVRGANVPAFVISRAVFVFGVSGVIFGLYLFFRGFQLLRHKRWIEDTPVTKISAAAIGRVKILGKACGPYTLISPLAGVDCYYYRAVAWDGRDAQNEEEEGWATETIFTPLFVEDETGRMRIDPHGARLELPYECDESISGTSMSEAARRFLRRHGLSTEGGTTVTECVIKPGDPLLVLGVLRENAPSARKDTCLSAAAANLQRCEQLESMGLPQSVLANAEKDDPAGVNAREFDLDPKVILGAADDREPFVLSRENPQRMLAGMARSSAFDIWGGPALSLFSLALVIKWLGLW
jgi:hypothetical protein